MKLSYKKLWVKLVELDMKKTELAKKAGISSTFVAKLGNGFNTTICMQVRACKYLDCETF
ncbi:helix-turn-helix transcriptional regulator [Anaerovoracaceae bacterium 41-7]|uniref:helix-turn-helix domain-containing protein n=1 Tax=Emergencia sp. 1XD21-10 TaxID=2304569 RepID=UPI0027D22DFE|nr:helix-turn-helix transcriptional regulator [Emergencia sp. 1XD21-10]